MILHNKNAIIYGAGGSIGGTVAKTFAAAGATVFLTGRTLSPVQKIADEIIASGGKADVSKVDALHETEIKNHIDKVIQKAGDIAISFNAIGYEVVQNIPLIDMSVSDFIRPITVAMQTQFMTATAAARVMKEQRSGVILSLTATPGGIGYPFTGGFAPACSAMESFSRNLAAELGIYNVRVVNIRSGGSPDSRVFKEAMENQPEVMKSVLLKMNQDSMLKRLPLMADIGNVAAFISSSQAGMITGVTIDVTGGTTAGLNYRVDKENFNSIL